MKIVNKNYLKNGVLIRIEDIDLDIIKNLKYTTLTKFKSDLKKSDNVVFIYNEKKLTKDEMLNEINKLLEDEKVYEQEINYLKNDLKDLVEKIKNLNEENIIEIDDEKEIKQVLKQNFDLKEAKKIYKMLKKFNLSLYVDCNYELPYFSVDATMDNLEILYSYVVSLEVRYEVEYSHLEHIYENYIIKYVNNVYDYNYFVVVEGLYNNKTDEYNYYVICCKNEEELEKVKERLDDLNTIYDEYKKYKFDYNKCKEKFLIGKKTDEYYYFMCMNANDFLALFEY